ncbi:hypothetical protein [Paraflavitalea speifideaquila]|uniref:hypothetical protein n=1 Tax=Paraflavitalea speifideaquila TaxID=3076558 RepID=UPI0028E809FD|nr:hypothetical protein [Paraflavitalea speifideiaquila]
MNDEYAVLKSNERDTFLATSKYVRMWVCNLPPMSVKINDTIVISGVVYDILGSERVKGWPTVLTKMVTK